MICFTFEKQTADVQTFFTILYCFFIRQSLFQQNKTAIMYVKKTDMF